jgi:hypothetical protein
MNRGLYEPSVMYFGMCNVPASFQQMVYICFHSVQSVIAVTEDPSLDSEPDAYEADE